MRCTTSSGRKWPSWAGSRSSTSWGGCSSPPDALRQGAILVLTSRPEGSPSGGFREHIGSAEHTATDSARAAAGRQRGGQANAARQVRRQLVHLDRRLIAGELGSVPG